MSPLHRLSQHHLFVAAAIHSPLPHCPTPGSSPSTSLPLPLRHLAAAEPREHVDGAHEVIHAPLTTQALPLGCFPCLLPLSYRAVDRHKGERPLAHSAFGPLPRGERDGRG